MATLFPEEGDPYGLHEDGPNALSPDEKAVRRKQIHDTAFAKHWRSVVAIKEWLQTDDPDMYSIAEAWNEIPQQDQLDLWLAPSKGGVFTTAERDAIKRGVPSAGSNPPA